MAWVRIDDCFTENDKIVRLNDREFRIHLRALCYTGRKRKPFILIESLPDLRANAKTAAKFVNDIEIWHDAAGLCGGCLEWLSMNELDIPDDAYMIHDWWKYQRDNGAERTADYRKRKAGVTDV